MATEKLLRVLKAFRIPIVEHLRPEVVYLIKPRLQNRTYYRVLIHYPPDAQRICKPLYTSREPESMSNDDLERLYLTYCLQMIIGTTAELLYHDLNQGWITRVRSLIDGRERTWADDYTPGIPELERIYPLEDWLK